MSKRSDRAGFAADEAAAARGKSLLDDDEPILWHAPAAPKPSRAERLDGVDALEAELEAAMEYILALEGDAGIDRIFAIVTRTVARRVVRRPS